MAAEGAADRAEPLNEFDGWRMGFLLGQFAPLGAWLAHPGLLLAAIAAMSLPVIIHLLNRRRYAIVEWAAIDFLLSAESENRRRIRFESLLLLFLRCLAVLLIGVVLARPLAPASVAARLSRGAPHEHIVLLDDSASMQARAGHESAFESARRRLSEIVADVARQPGDNRLTLLLASQPGRSVFDAAPLAGRTLDEIQAAIERLEPGDKRAQIAAALDQIESRIAASQPHVNRSLDVLTDLRQRDWFRERSATAPAKSDGGSPLGRLASLSHRLEACRLIDAAATDDGNMTIAAVRADGPLAVGVRAAIDVTIVNQGSSKTSGGSVMLKVDGALPVEQSLSAMAGGEAATLRFPLTIGGGEEAENETNSDPPPRRIAIELKSAEPATDDLLHADSTAYFAARVKRGARVLLIDGNPGAEQGRAEPYFLQRALAPPGQARSGILADVAAADELDSLDLAEYEILFLLNASRLGVETESQIARLERWVSAGGGLAIMPGDAVDAATFNQYFWRSGLGLAPLALESIDGDDRRETWAGLEVRDAQHEVFAPFAGQSNPLLSSTKVFRWWTAAEAPLDAKGISVPLRLTSARRTSTRRTPAFAEKTLGRGRVCQFAFPATDAWTTWPGDPSYLLVMQSLVPYLTSDNADAAQLRTGQGIRAAIDIARFEPGGVLTGPNDLHAEMQAVPTAAAGSGAPVVAEWQMRYADVARRGFYELELTRREGGKQQLLFAANIDPAEGDLKRMPNERLQRELAGSRVQFGRAAELSLATGASRIEVWRYALWLLAGVLAAEQVLGWLLGR